MQGTQNSTPNRRRPHHRERADCHGSSNDNPRGWRPAHGSGRRSRTHGSPPHALGQWIGRVREGGIGWVAQPSPTHPAGWMGRRPHAMGRTAPRGRVMRFENPRMMAVAKTKNAAPSPGEQTVERRDGLLDGQVGAATAAVKPWARGGGRGTANVRNGCRVSQRDEQTRGQMHPHRAVAKAMAVSPPAGAVSLAGSAPKGAYGAESRALATSGKLGGPPGAGVAWGGTRPTAGTGGQGGRGGAGKRAAAVRLARRRTIKPSRDEGVRQRASDSLTPDLWSVIPVVG